MSWAPNILTAGGRKEAPLLLEGLSTTASQAREGWQSDVFPSALLPLGSW